MMRAVGGLRRRGHGVAVGVVAHRRGHRDRAAARGRRLRDAVVGVVDRRDGAPIRVGARRLVARRVVAVRWAATPTIVDPGSSAC